MFEYSFGLQTQEVVELLTFKTFELQLLFEIVDEEPYQTHSISSSILFLNHSEEIVKPCGDDSNTISFIAQILTLGITNSSDIVAEYSSAGQITFSKSMLELDKTNEPEQAPNVHGFASFSGVLFENRWEDFIRVNEAILAVVERVQRKTRLDVSELAFPPLIRADILSEVTSTLLKVVKKDRRTFTQTCVNGPPLPHSSPFKGSPPLTSLPVSCLFSDVPNINPKRANIVCETGEVDWCVVKRRETRKIESAFVYRCFKIYLTNDDLYEQLEEKMSEERRNRSTEFQTSR
ncbi:hypothetical protein BLNAU_24972 [Blattamonas nauphoetae]|uniref:Uncharacterized protein n=1 Tax=Blattamonas nauphoetae TaxID=2049346 RepID=A0ABQ9WKW0_9EUKA|nr:hypothetical protein BLNAU_24972 [Blattamonas nauphoetae]